jgi:succinate dehydrogenase / fumarate reductase cytochrome b subunit
MVAACSYGVKMELHRSIAGRIKVHFPTVACDMLVNSEMARRPKYLNLLRIRLPLPGVISIMHRVSGAALFVALPLLLYWFQQSLTSFATFSALKMLFTHWPVKIVVIGLLWGYFHHLCAGLRHLALDLHFGTGLAAARLSSAIVLFVGVSLTSIAAVLLW